MKHTLISLLTLLSVVGSAVAQSSLTSRVNPFMGTATLWHAKDLGYTHTEAKRAWGAEVFPGAALPHAMVQLTPVTQYKSGAGYQYEDRVIYGFAHTCKGHWNLLHVPMLPATGNFHPGNYASEFSHEREEAHPGYYRVHLDRYNVDVELTSTLRCALHRYTFPSGTDRHLIIDITHSNNNPRRWDVKQSGPNAFEGYQDGEGRMYFSAETTAPIKDLRIYEDNLHRVLAVVDFADDASNPVVEVRMGCSFTDVEGARLNLAQELHGRSFAEVRQAADGTWETLLSHIRVNGGTEDHINMLYTTLYRTFLWPVLRSDVDGRYRDARGQEAIATFRYYTDPSFWDTYRNKLVLVSLFEPDVAADIISSCTDRGERRGGYMPTFFHGDHASTFVAGAWLRGVRGFDLQRAYDLILRNATVPGRGGRPYLDEYIAQGWIAEKDTTNVPTEDEYKAAVTKTVEYAYDDYATSLVATELGDKANAKLLLSRSQNYRNLFDPSTGFWRGKTADGKWIEDFDPYFPYYAYMYREANGWQSLFFAPHDPYGMIGLYPSHEAVEQKLDSLFTEPWRDYEAWNFTGFLGNYCHGNQPGHSIPYTYCFIDKQEKCQAVLNTLMNDYYGMGDEHLAYAGMDDAGETSAWYVLNAIGLYTYSPADPKYIVTVPLFERTDVTLGTLPAKADAAKSSTNGNATFSIIREGEGLHINAIRCGKQKVKGWFVEHNQLIKNGSLVISVD